MAPRPELPIHRGVVVARVVAVLVLDLALAVSGIYLIRSYLAERDMVENTTGSDELPAQR